MNPLWQPPPGWGNYTLKEFIEIPWPDPVSLWPATAAWWWPFGLIVLIATSATIRGVQRYRRNRYRREALARLDQLQSADEQGNVWSDLPVLLKATAIHAYGRETVASLHGEPWLEFLSQKAPAAGFNGPVGQALIEVDYLPRERWQIAPGQADALFSACAIWIRSHPLPTESPRGSFPSAPAIVNSKS